MGNIFWKLLKWNRKYGCMYLVKGTKNNWLFFKFNNKLLYLHKEQPHLGGGGRIAPPCFYSGPERGSTGGFHPDITADRRKTWDQVEQRKTRMNTEVAFTTWNLLMRKKCLQSNTEVTCFLQPTSLNCFFSHFGFTDKFFYMNIFNEKNLANPSRFPDLSLTDWKNKQIPSLIIRYK